MNENFNIVLALASALAVIVSVVLAGVKAVVVLPKNLIPVIGVVVGVAIGALAYPFTDLDLVYRLWAGAFAGFSATGLYELQKNNPGTTKKD
jgi:hypothetical protein